MEQNQEPRKISTYIGKLWYLTEGKNDRPLNEQYKNFANKGPSNQGYGFSSGHVWM